MAEGAGEPPTPGPGFRQPANATANPRNTGNQRPRKDAEGFRQTATSATPLSPYPMNTPHRFIFDPSKGQSHKHTCPRCGRRKTFKRYVDTQTGELLPEHVGKCDRLDNCGYHYPPRDYFRDGGIRPADTDGRAWEPEPPPRPPYLHQRAEVVALRARPERNTLSMYWRDRIGADRWDAVARDYALGTWQEGHMAGAAVYWQVDAHGKVKAGKVMLYDADGHRKKEGGTNWVHAMKGGIPDGHRLEQCLFGEHLLKGWPMDGPVAVVESEKTAMIAAALMPAFRWVAVGSVGGFTLNKLQALTGRKVLAFPDLSKDGTAYTKWREKAVEIGHIFDAVHISDVLERSATDADREAGLDIGDYLLREKDANTSTTTTRTTKPSAPASIPAMVLSEAEILLERMAKRNPSVNTLVEELGLDLKAARVRRGVEVRPA